jgi:hypothetical protein
MFSRRVIAHDLESFEPVFRQMMSEQYITWEGRTQGEVESGQALFDRGIAGAGGVARRRVAMVQ